MKRIQQYIFEHEAWFKKRIQEYLTRLECGDDSEESWSTFFAGLTPEAEDSGSDLENSRLHALLLSLKTPVLLLDVDLWVEAMNPAAVELLGVGEADAWSTGRHTPVQLSELAPWLVETVQEGCHEKAVQVACTLDATVAQPCSERFFNVSVSLLSNYSERQDGFAVVMDDISYRVESERQLAMERNRAAHFLDIVGTIVFALDASGAISMLNRTGCSILGYEEHELIGRDCVEALVPEDQQDEVHDYLYRAFSGQFDEEEERTHHVITKGGFHRLVRWHNKLLFNEDGMPTGLLGSGVDITEQQALEDALAEKELWLRNTFVALGEAVLILTPDWKILDANPAAETMFRMSNEMLEGLAVSELHVDQSHFESFVDASKNVFGSAKKSLFELPLRRKTGEVFPADHSVSLITGDDGAALGVVNVIRDISDRKRAEFALRQSEEKFRRIFETIEEGYIVTDLDGIVLMVNPATCRQLQYQEAELVGRKIGRLFQDEAERVELRRALTELGTLRGQIMTFKRKDGSTIVIEANAHLVRDLRGVPVAMEGTFRDITRRIEAERAIRDRERQYRAFFENNHAIMLLTDPQSEQIIDANPAASDFYGYPIEVLRTMNLSQINVLCQEEMFKEMRLAREEGRTYFIVRHVLANGEFRDVEVYSGPIMVQGVQRLYSVIHDVTKRIQLEQTMKRLATTDALTGANNRHQFFALATKELQRAKRYGNPLTVLMFDIDYFKSINDSHGHSAGDLVLKMLSATALSCLRESDIFGRLGGEEFAAVLPETGLRVGYEVAERLRQSFAKLEVLVGKARIVFTVSVGVTQVRSQDKTIEEVLNRADEALYKAKRMGRNQVVRG